MDLRSRFTIPALALALVALSAGAAHAQITVEPTKQAWLSGTIEADLARRLRLGLEEQVRLGAENNDETFTELGLHFRAAKALRIGAFYRYVLRDAGNRNRIGGDAELRLDAGRFGVRDRLRLEYTTREQGAITMLRERVKLAYDAPRHLAPFAAGELFYGIEPGEVRELRGSVGVDFDLTKKVELSAFYLYQHEMNVQIPERNHVFGLGVTWLVHEAHGGKHHGHHDHDATDTAARD